uniref:Uncharacterized protein n=1 Tax=Anguilla anguilla TaxID=7936 RepID=A0A0E9UID9_ANGAN
MVKDRGLEAVPQLALDSKEYRLPA